MFKVGEEVVCIDAKNLWATDKLVEGRRYIVEWIGMYHNHALKKDVLCVRVEGVTRAPPESSMMVVMMSLQILDKLGEDTSAARSAVDAVLSNPPFRATRFAPLRKTDISVLTRLLEPIKVLEDA